MAPEDEPLVFAGPASRRAAVAHGVFAAGSRERLDVCPIEELLVTDTVESGPEEASLRVRTVSAAPLFAEAARRMHRNQSVSELFAKGLT